MNTHVKITRRLLDRARADLERPHAFAHERVGFFTAGATAYGGMVMLLVRDYMPVDDADYVYDPTVGACIGSEQCERLFS